MWKTLSSEEIHKNKWYRIVKKNFETPEKKSGEYFVLETDGSSMVVPIKENRIIFGKQYRYTIDRWSIELPCGGVKRGSSYLKTAAEELEEEAGYKAGFIEEIGEFAPFEGVSSEICKVYLATDLVYVGNNLEDTEHIETMEVEIPKVYKMVEDGEIIAGMTIAALALARRVIKGK